MTQTTQASIEAFKQFMRKHPELIKGVKNKGKTWKEVFEEWVIFGEDHEIWNDYGIIHLNKGKKKSGQGESFSKILGYIKNADFDNIGEQLNQLNGALSNLSELITLFNPNQTDTQSTQPFNNRQQLSSFQRQQQPFQQAQSPNIPQQPFQFRRD